MIALLDKKLELNKDGKFPNEDIIHDLIFPRKSTTDQLAFEDHNLWIIDECLTFHAFAASERIAGSGLFPRMRHGIDAIRAFSFNGPGQVGDQVHLFPLSLQKRQLCVSPAIVS